MSVNGKSPLIIPPTNSKIKLIKKKEELKEKTSPMTKNKDSLIKLKLRKKS